VNTTKSGHGDLSIVVNEGAVPSKARKNGPNEYVVSFKPETPGHYVVELFFNGEPLESKHFGETKCLICF